jgi:peptide chain release factor 3
MTWPIGMGREFRGIYHFAEDAAYLYQNRDGSRLPDVRRVAGLAAAELDAALGAETARALREEVELVRGATPAFDCARYLAGTQTPVFFGAAIHNYGVKELLDSFVRFAPPPQPRAAETRIVDPGEDAFSGFVFKIQANMDPAHRDRIAFLRVCSGSYEPGMRVYHTRLRREVRVGDAITFMAADRQHADEAYAGDIIGLHNHGTINIGDSFTQGEALAFTGIPNFAPELFRRAVLRDPLKLKALQKGLDQLCEEGATQLFRPLQGKDLILGAVGPLQFEVASFRLRDEYGVDCAFEAVNVAAARWVGGDDPRQLEEFTKKLAVNLAKDHGGELVFLAPSTVSLSLTEERWPKLTFSATREHRAGA